MIPLKLLLFCVLQSILLCLPIDASSKTWLRSTLLLPALIHVSHSRGPAAEELENFRAQNLPPGILVTGNGVPIDDKNRILQVGPRGPVLLQDFVFLDEIAHFNRERIPERIAHAKGAGAFGYFEVTHDVTPYTKLNALSAVGKRTRVAVRFSTRIGESGSADTQRDIQGLSVKFYTEEGNWDLITQNNPLFYHRDPLLFPSFIHIQKRNPVTHLRDGDMFWDILAYLEEATLAILMENMDTAIPDGYRHMSGFSVNAYKLVNARGEAVFCKFIFKPNQGEKYLSFEKGAQIAGMDPDYYIRDLYNSIASKNYPSWTLYLQIMTLDEAENYRFNPFDSTKIWTESEFPLTPVGQLILNENPSNYFNDVEQIAFCPSHMPPGVEPSPDKVLQARMFAYADAQRYRLGANYLQLPVNCPLGRVANYQRDGANNIRMYDGGPNYYPNSFNGPVDDLKYRQSIYTVSGEVGRNYPVDNDNYTQPREFWLGLKESEQTTVLTNLAPVLGIASEAIQKRMLDNFRKVDEDLARRLAAKLEALKNKA